MDAAFHVLDGARLVSAAWAACAVVLQGLNLRALNLTLGVVSEFLLRRTSILRDLLLFQINQLNVHCIILSVLLVMNALHATQLIMLAGAMPLVLMTALEIAKSLIKGL